MRQQELRLRIQQQLFARGEIGGDQLDGGAGAIGFRLAYPFRKEGLRQRMGGCDIDGLRLQPGDLVCLLSSCEHAAQHVLRDVAECLAGGRQGEGMGASFEQRRPQPFFQ